LIHSFVQRDDGYLGDDGDNGGRGKGVFRGRGQTLTQRYKYIYLSPQEKFTQTNEMATIRKKEKQKTRRNIYIVRI
jgi:hypothetical protein